MHTLNIGAVIKTLRRERGITQERLAEYLNVTPQAISRWECGLAMPDITAVPTIAAFFGVSCDRLLGTERDDRQARIDAIRQEEQRLASLGKKQEQFALLQEAVREFPGEYRLLLDYAWALSASPYDDFGETDLTEEEHRALHEQVIGLGKKILDDCTDDRLRAGALDLMSMEYHMMGDPEKAQATAERLPDFRTTRNMALFRLWNYDTQEHRAFFQQNIAELADLLWLHIRTVEWGTDDPEKKIMLCEKAAAVYHTLYENEDFRYGWYMLSQIWKTEANAYADLGREEDALRLLQKATDALKRFEEASDGCGASLLSDCLLFERGKLIRNTESSDSSVFPGSLNDSRYAFLRQVDNASFLQFLENESIIRNFNICDNIVNAGKPGYAAKSMSFYTADGTPSNSYISFCENIYDEIIIEIKTNNQALIYAALCETKNISGRYKKILFGAGSYDFFESSIFKKMFEIKKSYLAEYGVFAQFSKGNVPMISVPDNVSIELVANTEKASYADYDDDLWDGLPSLIQYGNDTDMFFVLKENGDVCGYLMANSSYKNIYDIANLFVLEKYRGKGFGTYLTVTFSNHCYDNNCIPHYGTAVSKYSEAVALKSGFEEVYRQYFVDVKVKP